MGAFKSAVITKKGQELLAKVVAGTTKLEFTKIKVSDTKLSGDLATLIVLALNTKGSQAPKASGVPYDKGAR